MKTAVSVLFLVAGLANSAILDSSKFPGSKKSDWDDEDSMTLVSTSTSIPEISQDAITSATPQISDEDQITEEQQRPRFISLIPAGTHDVNTHSQSDQEGQDQIKYRISQRKPVSTTATEVNAESEQDDSSSSSTTPSSSSEEEANTTDSQDSVSDEQATTGGSQIRHIQLGKIPLTYEIIPLLPPREEKQQLLGREDTKPIGFFPPEEIMMNKRTKLQKEQEQKNQQQSSEEDTTEIITGKPVVDLKELQPVPLTYMVPPQHEGETYWRQYPQSTTMNLDLPQTSTINPLLERINDFLQKAKRHSLEMETTTRNDDESSTTTSSSAEDDQNTEQVETTTTAEEQKDNDSSTDATTGQQEGDKENISTTDPLTPVSDVPEDSNGDLNPSSPAPIPEEPTEEIFTTSRGPTILYPRPNTIEEEQDYSPESQPILPYYTPSSSLSPLPPSTSPLNNNGINIRPSSMDQYYSDYYSNINRANNVPPQQPQRQYNVNPYYYRTNSNSNPAAASFLQRRMMISSLLNNKPIISTTTTTTLPPPPSRPIYISPDSYWPRTYFNNNNNNRRVGTGFGYNANNAGGGYNNNIYTPTDYNTNSNNYNTNYNNPFMMTPPPSQSASRGGYYNYLIRPQRRSPAYNFPSNPTSISIGAAALNSLLSATSEEPSNSYGVTAANLGLNDFSSSYANPSYYSPSSIGSGGSDDYYSAGARYPSTNTQVSSPYVLNYRPMIQYRSSYPITSSDLVNDLMYAPLYPYEQYRRAQVQQPGYY